MVLIYTLLATGVVSLGGLLGVISLWIKEKTLKNWLRSIVALAAGVMLGVTFLDLLPEAAHHLESEVLFPWLLVGFIGFFFIEKVLLWRHCHDEKCEVHSFGYMNLIGDAIHNLVDGLLIGTTFQVSTQLGVVTTLAVALHEIPQEISDFGVLLYSGMNKTRALFFNFLVAVMAVVGGVVAVTAAEFVEGVEPYLLVLAGASFLYIAASDLVPELRKAKTGKQIVSGFGVFMIGIIMVLGLQQVVGHSHEGEVLEQVEEDHHQGKVE